jgi:hypothetical protein
MSNTFTEAWHAANNVLNPTPETRHLLALAWASATIRCCEAHGLVFGTEKEQYVALYESKKAQFNRPLSTRSCEELRQASRNIWSQRAVVRRATWRVS